MSPGLPTRLPTYWSLLFANCPLSCVDQSVAAARLATGLQGLLHGLGGLLPCLTGSTVTNGDPRWTDHELNRLDMVNLQAFKPSKIFKGRIDLMNTS